MAKKERGRARISEQGPHVGKSPLTKKGTNINSRVDVAVPSPGIESDVREFVANLGFPVANSTSEASGFDDSDFKKKGPINKLKTDKASNNGKAREQPPGGKKKTVPRPKVKDEKSRSQPNVPKGKSSIGTQRTMNASKVEFPTALEPVTTLSQERFTSWRGDDIMEQGSHWNDVLISCLKAIGAVNLESDSKNAAANVEARIAEGEALLSLSAANYEKQRSRDSDSRWLDTARRSGTTADRIAALTVMVQEDPVSNLRSLDALLAMAFAKGGKGTMASAMDAMKELFLTSLLPPRKLKHLSQQPLQVLEGKGHEKEKKRVLLLWKFEDALKERYEKFVGAVEQASRDALPFVKEKSLRAIHDLLSSKPEQERRLLLALINKLGDPERKIASKAGYYLSLILTAHPNMKLVVVRQVDQFVFRPHVGLKAQYYAAVFLNQIVLSHKGDGPVVARHLIDVYFALFKTLTEREEAPGKGPKQEGAGDASKEKGRGVEVDSRLLAALLTGVNRAFPYVSSDDVDALIEQHTPSLFRMVHSSNFNLSVQALMLLQHLLSAQSAVSSRFYRALYSVLLSPACATSSKVAMFLNVLFRAVKADLDSVRASAFVKRLLQVSLHQQSQFTCGALMIVSEILKLRPSLWNHITMPEDQGDDIETFEDLDAPSDVGSEDSDGEGEVGASRDSDDEDDVAGDKIDLEDTEEPAGQLTGGSTNAGWESSATAYKWRHRDPAFCGADAACWWELVPMAIHSHPSVSAMARTLLAGANISYAGDPLQDLNLTTFLDRLVEKKPKVIRSADSAPADEEGPSHSLLSMRGSSLMQPMRRVDAKMYPIGMQDFAAMDESQVAAEDVFFHKFYLAKKEKKNAPKKRGMRGSDGEEDDSEGGSDELSGDDGAADRDESEEEGDRQQGGDGRDLAGKASAASDSEDEVVGEDDSDNEEIDNMLEDELMEDLSLQSDDDDDESLEFDGQEEDSVAVSVNEAQSVKSYMETMEDVVEEEDEEEDDDVEFVDFGADDDGSDSDDDPPQKGRRKVSSRSRVSPFVDAEDYARSLGTAADGKGSKSSSRKHGGKNAGRRVKKLKSG